MFFIGRGDLRLPAGVHRTPLRLWRFAPVYRPEMNEIVRCTMKSSLRSDEIFGVSPQMKLNPPPSPAERQISSRSDFIHRRWISSAEGGFSCKKHLLTQVLFAVMGVALDRYLPGHNAMLVTSPMYYVNCSIILFSNVSTSSNTYIV